MRERGGVPWPAAADFFFFLYSIFYLFSWEVGVLAAMLSRLATSLATWHMLSALLTVSLTVPCCTIDHLHSSRP